MVSVLDSLVSGAEGACREGVHAWFFTPTPWIAPAAHLHVVFKPAPTEALQDVARRMRFPGSFAKLLSSHNGATLFCGDLAVYGVHQVGQLLNRTDPYARLPFNIEWENDSWRNDRDRLLVIGGYRYDGSRVCADRTTAEVSVFPRDGGEPIAVFKSVEDWLTVEIARFRRLYDAEGRFFGTQEETGPPGSMDSRKSN